MKGDGPVYRTHSPNPVKPMVTASWGSGADGSEPVSDAEEDKEEASLAWRPWRPQPGPPCPASPRRNPPSLGPGRSMAGSQRANEPTPPPKQLQDTRCKPLRKYRLRGLESPRRPRRHLPWRNRGLLSSAALAGWRGISAAEAAFQTLHWMSEHYQELL